MKGIYLLIIKTNKNLQLRIGSLGRINFGKGLYVYAGSAQNNLEKRVSRHKSKNKKVFWHIDYLLKNKSAKVIKVFYKKANKTEECKIAKKLNESEIPIKEFGCSDCNCKSHLFKIKNIKNILKLGVKSYEHELRK
ncbi:MAG: GIY-YIG nuclease family protein [Nanoarchaeota archaeon]|nr:GIY-YIG nuclease family protein [Nanoarchaeota archaeon]